MKKLLLSSLFISITFSVFAQEIEFKRKEFVPAWERKYVSNKAAAKKTVNAEIDLLLKKGRTAEDAGDYKSASLFYKQAEDINAVDPAVLFSKAYNLLSMGDSWNALTVFDKAVKVDTASAELYFGKGLAAVNTKNFSLAEYEFSQCIKLSQDADCYYNRGVIRVQQEMPDSACADFLLAKKLGCVKAKEIWIVKCR